MEMNTEMAVDIREIVLSNSSFGPAEIEGITHSIAEDISRYSTLRNAVMGRQYVFCFPVLFHNNPPPTVPALSPPDHGHNNYSFQQIQYLQGSIWCINALISCLTVSVERLCQLPGERGFSG